MTLRDANVVLIDCVHDTPPAAESGLPYLAIPQMKTGSIDLSDARLISAQHFDEWTQKADPREHDVVLSRRCNPGVTAPVRQGVRFALGQNLVLLRADGSRVHPPYLRWLVSSPDWWHQIAKFINVGAVFDSLRCADVPKFELPVPSLDEQRRIAAVLGALDDKIELNRKMNRTLEEMAQALFKSWFIDFDGHDPAEMVDSELGLIPRGWAVKPLLDVVNLLSGGTPRTSEPSFWGGEVKWATAKDVSNCSGRYLVDTERTITEAGLHGSATKLIPNGAVAVVARGATCGRWCLFGETVAMNQTCYAIVARQPEHETFVKLLVPSIIVRLVQQAHGSIFDTITTKTFETASVVVPPDSDLHRLKGVLGPVESRMLANAYESRTLATLRDTLLPKLISGELRVPEAEAAVEEAL